MTTQHNQDVLVIGGGMGGVGAAWAAARNGATTTLIEAQGCLGGLGTAGLVPAFAPLNFGQPEGPPLIRGLTLELIERIRTAGGIYPTSNWWLLFDKEIAKVVLERTLLEAGVRLRYLTTFIHAERKDDRIVRIETISKSGRETWTAANFIDATGDADVCASAGVPFDVGDDRGDTMPPTLCFVIDGVDREKVPDVQPVAQAIYRGKAEGKLTNAQDFRGCKDLYGPHGLVLNYNHVYGINGLDADDLTRGMIEGRRIAFELLEYLRTHVPGFEKACLVATAPLMGVRETRRIRGRFQLTGDAYFEAKTHDDDVCVYDYPADLHQARNSQESREQFEKLYYHTRIDPGKFYGIPYRCLLPVGLTNLAAAGRCVSCDRIMLASLRVMPACLAMGEAGGTAAALAARDNQSLTDVSPTRLRNTLIKNGAYLP